MSILPRWLSGLITKSDPAFQYAQLSETGRPAWSERDYKTFSEEGYKKNAIVFQCIRKLAIAAAACKLELHDGDTEVEEHPILDLLAKPNSSASGSKVLEAMWAYRLLHGNSYMLAIGEGDENAPRNPTELWPLRPDRVTAVVGRSGVVAWEYSVNGAPKKWTADPIADTSPLMHWKSFNPLDDVYGMSPLQAAAYSVDQHNAAGAWNKALLDNGAKVGGAFVVGSQGGTSTGVLTDAQFERLEDQIRNKMSGARNAGRPLILEGGLDWKAMGLSPQDMDWLNGKNLSAREICGVFGTPPQIVGIQGDSTYANYAEARLAFYEDTVLPMLYEYVDELNTWLLPMFDGTENMRLCVDEDDIPALASRRESKWGVITAAPFLTINEKREALGYEKSDAPEADELFVAPNQLPLRGSMDPTPQTTEGQDGQPSEKKPVTNDNNGDGGDNAEMDALEKANARLLAHLEEKYSPDQARDERGRWAGVDSAGARVNLNEARRGGKAPMPVSKPAPKPEPKAPANAAERREAYSKNDPNDVSKTRITPDGRIAAANVDNAGNYIGKLPTKGDYVSGTKVLHDNGLPKNVKVGSSITLLKESEQRAYYGAIMNAHATSPLVAADGHELHFVEGKLRNGNFANHIGGTDRRTITVDIKQAIKAGGPRAPLSLTKDGEKPGWFASSSMTPTDVINHEVGHAKTPQRVLKLPYNTTSFQFNGGVSQTTAFRMQEAAAKVSKYAEHSVHEFVAESYAAHLSGRQLSHSVHQYYKLVTDTELSSH